MNNQDKKTQDQSKSHKHQEGQKPQDGKVIASSQTVTVKKEEPVQNRNQTKSDEIESSPIQKNEADTKQIIDGEAENQPKKAI